MKITFTTPNNIPVIVEGMPEEINATLDRLLDIAPKRATVIKQDTPVVAVDRFDQVKVNNFLNGIYLYEANTNTSVGKARAIADILCDGKKHSISDVAKKTNAVIKTVNNNINHMRRHGATITVNGDTVIVDSIPTKRLPKKRRVSNSYKLNVATNVLPDTAPQSQGDATQPTSIIAGFKLS